MSHYTRPTGQMIDTNYTATNGDEQKSECIRYSKNKKKIHNKLHRTVYYSKRLLLIHKHNPEINLI